MKPPPRVVLGTINYGRPGSFEGVTVSSPADVNAMLGVLQNHGHRDIDTARIYGAGTAEEVLADAQWQDRRLVVGTKLYPTKGKPMSHLGPAYDFSPLDVRRGVLDSLKALKTQRLPLWFLYAPDRRIPLRETLAEVDKMIKEGLIDQYGISNYMSWEVAILCETCDRNGWVKPTVYQGLYNVLHRAIEPELVPCLRHYGISLSVAQPLAGGFLSSRYYAEYPESAHPSRSRFDPQTLHGKHHRSRYWNAVNFEALAMIRAAAARHQLTEAECALRWLRHHSQVDSGKGDSVIVAASDVSQLENDLRYLEQDPLPSDVVEALDTAWLKVKAVAPRYNH